MSTETLRQSLWRERSAISNLPAVTKGERAQEVITLLQAELRRYGALRRSAFCECQRDMGSTYGDLAAIFGVSRQRAHEIVSKRL